METRLVLICIAFVVFLAHISGAPLEEQQIEDEKRGNSYLQSGGARGRNRGRKPKRDDGEEVADIADIADFVDDEEMDEEKRANRYLQNNGNRGRGRGKPKRTDAEELEELLETDEKRANRYLQSGRQRGRGRQTPKREDEDIMDLFEEEEEKRGLILFVLLTYVKWKSVATCYWYR